MAQFARPNADVTLASWVDEASGTTNIYASIDETTASDTDFVSGGSNTNDTYITGLSSVTDPASSTGHIVRYRYRKSAAAGNARDIQVELRQGATLIATGTAHTGISETWTAGTFTLSGAEADSITDYTALRLSFIASGTTGGPGGNRRSVQASWAELETPNAVTTSSRTVPQTASISVGLPGVFSAAIVAGGSGNTGWSAKSLFRPSMGVGNGQTIIDIVGGIDVTSARVAQSFTPEASGTLDFVHIGVFKQGTPTDDHIIEILADSGSNTPSGTVLASHTFDPSPLTTTDVSSSFPRFDFASPPSLTASTKYWLSVRRVGAADATNRLSWRMSQDATYPDGGRSLYNGLTATWGAESSTVDVTFKAGMSTAQRPLYLVTQDAKLHVWRSTDNGATWTERDAVNAPTVSNSAYPFSGYSDVGTDLLTAYFSAANTLRLRNFNTYLDAYESTDINNTDATTAADNLSNIRVFHRPRWWQVNYTSSTDDANLHYARRATGAYTSNVAVLAINSTERSIVADVVMDAGWHAQQFYYDAANDDFSLRSIQETTLGTEVDLDDTAAADETLHASANYAPYRDGVDKVLAAFIDADGTLEARVCSLDVTSASVTLGTQAQVGSSTSYAGRQLATCKFGSDLYIFASTATGIDVYRDVGGTGTWGSVANWLTGLTTAALSTVVPISGVGILVSYVDNGDAKVNLYLSPRTIPQTASIAVVSTFTRTVPQTSAILTTTARTVPQSAAVQVIDLARTIPQTAAIQTTNTRTVPQTAAISETFSRTIPQTASISVELTLDRTIPQTAAILTDQSRTVTQTAAITVTDLARTLPQSVAILTEQSRAIPQSASVSVEFAQTIPQSAAISEALSQTVPQSAVILTENVQTIPQSAAVQTETPRTVPQSAAIQVNALTRTVPQSAAVLTTQSRTVPQTAAILVSFERTIPQSTALRVTTARTIAQTASIAVTGTLTREVPQSAAISVANNARTIAQSAAVAIVNQALTVPQSAAVETTSLRTISQTAAIRTTTLRTVPQTASISAGFSSTVPQSAALRVTNSRTVPQTAALRTLQTRTIPQSAAISQQFSRTIPQTASIQVIAVLQSTVPQTAAIRVTDLSRTIPQTAALSVTNQPRTIPQSTAIATANARTVSQTAAVLTEHSGTIPQSASVATLDLLRLVPQSAAISVVNLSHAIPQTAAIIILLYPTLDEYIASGRSVHGMIAAGNDPPETIAAGRTSELIPAGKP